MFYSSSGDIPPVNNKRYYDILEIEKTATSSEIKKAYKRMAKLHHPDKGGDPDVFKKVTKAHEILGDPVSRENYDTYGEDFPDGGCSMGEDILGNIFGHMSRGGQKKQKGRDVTVKIGVSLEQVCLGVVKKLSLTRTVFDREKGIEECKDCAGNGMVSHTVRMGTMTQTIRQPCSRCGGRGNITHLKSQEETLDVYIDKGMPNGHRITFPEKGDEHPGIIPGDVNVVIENKPHKHFVRDKANLIHMRRIPLCDALTGVSFTLKHPDGRQLLVRTPPGMICHPEIPGEWEVLQQTSMDSPNIAVISGVTSDRLDEVKDICTQKGCTSFVWDSKERTATLKDVKRNVVHKQAFDKDGHVTYITPCSPPVKVIRNEGLPIYHNTTLNGDLIIRFEIVFPETICPTQIDLLRSILKDPRNICDDHPESTEEMEECTLEAIDAEKTQGGNFEHLYRQDDDTHAGGAPQVAQCSQQ